MGVVAASTGCANTRSATPATHPASATPEHVANVTATMDSTLAEIKATRLVRELVPADVPIPRNDSEKMAELEELLQKGIHSLYVSGTFLEQPPEVQAHPEMQRRVLEALPVMDETVRWSTVILANLTREDPREFQQALHRYPDLAMRVAEAIDDRAGDAGISSKRRMQLRLAAMEITSRLRDQHPAVFADEYLRKTNKVYVRRGQSELARKVAANTAEQMFWAPVAAGAGATTTELTPYAPSPMPTYQPQATPSRLQGPPARLAQSEPEEEPGKPGTGALKAAGWMFGISLSTLLVGVLLVEAGAFPGVFGITFGVLGLFAAVITALVGIIIRVVKG